MDILSNDLFPFTLAAAFMLAAGIVQAAGLNLEIDLDADANYLSWLGIGRIPFMMLVMLALGLFAFIGYAVMIFSPTLLAGYPSVTIAGFGSLVGTVLLAPALAKVIPQDETTSVRLEDLVRRRGQTCLGTATEARPAQAKVKDRHGKTHTVWIKPVPGSDPIPADEEILLVDFDEKTRVFIATQVDSIFRPFP